MRRSPEPPSTAGQQRLHGLHGLVVALLLDAVVEPSSVPVNLVGGYPEGPVCNAPLPFVPALRSRSGNDALHRESMARSIRWYYIPQELITRPLVGKP